MAVSLYCSKDMGTTTGDDLANLVQGIIEKHGHGDRGTSVNTDFEPAMVKEGRVNPCRSISAARGTDSNHPSGWSSQVME